MKIRCAVVCPIATGGGISEAFVLSLDMLRDGGVTPVAIVDERFPFIPRLKARGYEVHTLREIQEGGALHLLRQLAALARVLDACKPDLMVLNNGRFVRGLKLLRPKIPMVVVYHGGKVSRFMKADRVITINDDQKGYMIEAGYAAARVVVVDNAYPADVLPPYAPKPRSGALPVVGTLRLLEPAKGVDVLVEAMGILAARGLRLRTLIGSNGSQRAMLEARVQALGIADLVEFRGWIENKAAFFEEMDLYVLPSRAEEWGIGIVEANAARLPVVATACLGPKRIVRDGETGLLVPVADPAAMADAIEALAKDPVRAEALARNAYAYCAENYLYPRIQPVFVREVLEVLASGRR